MRPRTATSILSKTKAPALLITHLVNIHYLTGMQVSAGLVLVTRSGIRLFVDSRYHEAAEKGVYSWIKVYPIEDLTRFLRRLNICGFEADNVSVQRLSQWKRTFKSTKFVQNLGVIEEFRRSKDHDELRNIRKAQRITEKILKRVSTIFDVGISEQAVAWKLDQWAREYGADGLSFDPIVAFGTHTARPHHHPTQRKLQKGHLIQIDVGARYKGYCADKSRVFCTAPMTSEQKRVYQAVLHAKREAELLVKAGRTTQEIDRAARRVLEEQGLNEYFTHSLGHGVGLEIHEGPSLSLRGEPVVLLEHEVVTIEPGVYIPGKFGMRIEDEIRVQK